MTYEDCLKLTADKWNALDVDTKVEILNTLEAHEAEVNSRIACPVEGRFLYTGNDGIVMGQYDRNTCKIYINDSQLAPDSKYGASSDRILTTLLHEGRHSYQHQAVTGVIIHDETETKVWNENFQKYITFQEDPKGYYTQPVEVDARNYASQRYQEILSERDTLSQLHTETKQNDVCFSQILQTPDTTSNLATPLSNETDLDEAKSSFIEQMESTVNLSYETDHEDISYIDSYDDSYEDSASESITI